MPLQPHLQRPTSAIASAAIVLTTLLALVCIFLILRTLVCGSVPPKLYFCHSMNPMVLLFMWPYHVYNFVAGRIRKRRRVDEEGGIGGEEVEMGMYHAYSTDTNTNPSHVPAVLEENGKAQILSAGSATTAAGGGKVPPYLEFDSAYRVASLDITCSRAERKGVDEGGVAGR